jgi:F-type H+-transporting ATPase subunit b
MEPEIQHSAEQTIAAHPVEAVAEHATGQPVELWYQDPHFFVALAFVGFLLVFARYVWPLIATALDARATKIKGQLEQAAKLKAEAEALLKEYEKQKRAAQKEAKTLIEDARREAGNIRARGAEELRLSLERRTQQTQEKIARAEAEATARIRAQLVDIATEAARQVVVLELKDCKDDPAIIRAIASIERQIH